MKGDSRKSVDFLKKWSPLGPWVITAIAIDKKKIETTTFFDKTEADLLAFLERHNGERNIYFSVNQPNREMSSKCNKEDIKSAGWLHVDIDPADGQDISEERERVLSMLTDRLPKGIPSPTVIIFSGGGYQAFWKLDEPVVIDGDIQKAEEFELYNKRLEQIFGGDHCFNVDRIMRLPGTVNIPDAKKRKKGRVEELAAILEFNKKTYSLGDFKKAQGVQTSGPTREGGEYGVEVNIPGNIEKILDLTELDQWNVPDRVKIIIAQGLHPEQPKEKDNSRSAWLFDCICSLIRCGVPHHVIYALITDPEWGIAQSVVELRSGAHKYAIRQIKRGLEYCEDPNLTMMNDRHAIIGNIGGKCRVIEEINDDILHRTRITMSSFEDIRNRYSNKKVVIGQNDKGQSISIALGKYWLDHPMRRQYDTMKFMPNGDEKGVYNLWRGFSVEPRPGDCSLFLEHIRVNICNGNQEHYDYLIKWMARVVQQPASHGEVAIVLRGGKGTGKSFFATEFGRLFGRHTLQISNPSHLVGNFNSHLRDVLLLFSDEAFFAGDKKHESVLKTLVTENAIPIEAKGVDVEVAPNFIHLIMASNDPHVIRASGDERRYLVLGVGESKKQDKNFFKAVKDQLMNGGYEALLYFLQEVDLSNFQVRDVPNTEALQEQKLLSMNIDEEWWFRKLENGRILETDADWRELALCDSVITDFTNYADKWKFSRRGNETSLGRFLARVCPHMGKSQRRVAVEDRGPDGMPMTIMKRAYFYDFGSLNECRQAWEKIYGKIDWSAPVKFDEPLNDPPF